LLFSRRGCGAFGRALSVHFDTLAGAAWRFPISSIAEVAQASPTRQADAEAALSGRPELSCLKGGTDTRPVWTRSPASTGHRRALSVVLLTTPFRGVSQDGESLSVCATSRIKVLDPRAARRPCQRPPGRKSPSALAFGEGERADSNPDRLDHNSTRG